MHVIREGSAIAAELMLILSAPASKIAPASSRVRTPPPTVKGTNSSRAVRRTASISVLRGWCARRFESASSGFGGWGKDRGGKREPGWTRYVSPQGPQARPQLFG